jgi:phosphatidylinositol glycan class C protein
MLFLNLLFHDYDSLDVALFSKTFSFNAALFACVCLASRFDEQENFFRTFSLITISFILFALWPEYRRNVQQKFPSYGILWLSVSTLFTCIAMLVSLKLWSFVFVYVLTLFVISLVCPAILMKLQEFKNIIHGSWDEASVKLT